MMASNSFMRALIAVAGRASPACGCSRRRKVISMPAVAPQILRSP
jgi:hypothetical protein